MQKDNLSAVGLIYLTTLNSHVFPFWTSLMKKALNILVCYREGWPSYCSWVCVCMSLHYEALAFLFLCCEPCYWTRGTAKPDTGQKPSLKVKSGATFNIGIPYPFRLDYYSFNLGNSLKGLLRSCTLQFQMRCPENTDKAIFYSFFACFVHYT